MDVAERRAAHVTGWSRAFCLSDRRFRGCPSKPGLMMALDRGGACSGVALRMDTGDHPEAALVDLLKKEPPVPPELVSAETEAGTVETILFAAKPSFPLYQPEPPVEDLADILGSAVGHVGTMAEYLLNTVIELERAGLRSDTLNWSRTWSIQARRRAGLRSFPLRPPSGSACPVSEGDPGRYVVVPQLFRDAATEIENPVFHEGKRARNGLRHGLRLLAVAKSWSKTNGLALEVVPGGGIEPPTRGFSIHCSTPELPGHGKAKAALGCSVLDAGGVGDKRVLQIFSGV